MVSLRTVLMRNYWILAYLFGFGVISNAQIGQECAGVASGVGKAAICRG